MIVSANVSAGSKESLMIATQPFGKTGHDSTRIIFGAAALSDVTQDDADRTIELVLGAGVNHIDTAASYGDSELRLGPWMEKHRKDVFLATKTGDRTEREAYDSIRRSLDRLRVDNVDLIQLHNLVEPEEWEIALGPGGALDAAIRAKDEGLVRFIGVTGHGVTVAAQHRRSLERYAFDSVLLPYSYVMHQNPQYAADWEALFAICQERGVAVQTIKSITLAPWGERTPTTSTWYEPLREQSDIDLAVSWVLGRPGVFLNTVGDIHILPRVLDAASHFESRPSDEQMQALVESRHMEPLFV
jgi:aryl-alcohol dehydrogenase-like predicted oxidoreductase